MAASKDFHKVILHVTGQTGKKVIRLEVQPAKGAPVIKLGNSRKVELSLLDATPDPAGQVVLTHLHGGPSTYFSSRARHPYVLKRGVPLRLTLKKGRGLCPRPTGEEGEETADHESPYAQVMLFDHDIDGQGSRSPGPRTHVDFHVEC